MTARLTRQIPPRLDPRLSLHREDDDLEPFLSEIFDEALPPRSRLGSLHYLDARETFLSPEHRDLLDAARERI